MSETINLITKNHSDEVPTLVTTSFTQVINVYIVSVRTRTFHHILRTLGLYPGYEMARSSRRLSFVKTMD